MKISVQFGAFAPPLREQVGVRGIQATRLQRDADAITRLAVRGLLSDAETGRARRRLMKRILQQHRAPKVQS